MNPDDPSGVARLTGWTQDGLRPGSYLERLSVLADARARQWSDNVDISQGVGARHHVVPAFYLRLFASPSGHLLVRDRDNGTFRVQSFKDLAIRDFYTVINNDGEKDASMEQVLCMIENQTAELFQRLLSPFRAAVPLTVDERMTLATFMAMQNVRGLRTRREVELLANYHVHLMHGGTKLGKKLAGLTAVPHPNEHIRLFTASEAFAGALMRRPVTRVTLDAPLLITGDEPVLVVNDDHVHHLPECFRSAKGRRIRLRKNRQAKRETRELVHIYPTKPSGVAVAEMIMLPVGPRSLLVFGPEGSDTDPHIDLAGQDAVDAAEEVNRLVIDQAYSWIAAHVDHDSVRTCPLPPVGPIVNICDGGTRLSRELQAAPSPRMPRILGRS
ncbi:DUF4238 domain-containing protein [Hamadaea sp. NPDC050747]|uniref:DUF4238 domain-containing protein n=1 Tax=Hamadaea sp. NPDC050747 TaxID=3155789 RepID=UPI0033C2C4FD